MVLAGVGTRPIVVRGPGRRDSFGLCVNKQGVRRLLTAGAQLHAECVPNGDLNANHPFVSCLTLDNSGLQVFFLPGELEPYFITKTGRFFGQAAISTSATVDLAFAEIRKNNPNFNSSLEARIIVSLNCFFEAMAGLIKRGGMLDESSISQIANREKILAGRQAISTQDFSAYLMLRMALERDQNAFALFRIARMIMWKSEPGFQVAIDNLVDLTAPIQETVTKIAGARKEQAMASTFDVELPEPVLIKRNKALLELAIKGNNDSKPLRMFVDRNGNLLGYDGYGRKPIEFTLNEKGQPQDFVIIGGYEWNDALGKPAREARLNATIEQLNPAAAKPAEPRPPAPDAQDTLPILAQEEGFPPLLSPVKAGVGFLQAKLSSKPFMGSGKKRRINIFVTKESLSQEPAKSGISVVLEEEEKGNLRIWDSGDFGTKDPRIRFLQQVLDAYNQYNQ